MGMRARVAALCGILAALLCGAAFAADTLYAVNGGKLHFDKVSGSIMAVEKSAIKVALPSEIQGAPVLAVADGAFAGCANLTGAKFAYGLTSVGAWAFHGCTKLEGVELPDSVTEIGEGAFADCPALSRFRIPEGVETVGAEAFAECAKLSEIAIPKSVRDIGANAFENCPKLAGIGVEEGNAHYSASDGALFSADGTWILRYPEGKRETSYHIPDGVRYIGAHTFRHCGKLVKAAIPDGVISIEDFAFFDCPLLAEITIPDGVRAIGAGAFSFSGLEYAIIPESVVSIEALAFSPCEKLRDIYYAGSAEQWARALGEDGADAPKSDAIPDGVTVHFNAAGPDFRVTAPPAAKGHALKASDLRGLKAIDIPLSVSGRIPATDITVMAPFYDADGRFLGMGFGSATADAATTYVTAPVTGDVSEAASVQVTLCEASRPVIRAESYHIAD